MPGKLTQVEAAQAIYAHRVTQRMSPTHALVQCSCGWHTQVSRKQNARARAAKVRAAIGKHQAAVEASTAALTDSEGL